MKYLNGHIVIRLTSNEINQVFKKNIGETFYHINLQHSGIPYRDFQYKNYYAARLKTKGIEDDVKKQEPILDMSKVALLELIEIKHSIPMIEINPASKHNNKELLNKVNNFILESNKGLYESVWNKYKNIRKLKKKDFDKMNVFIRKFKLIEIQNYPQQIIKH